jgi:hypothetical protein
VSKGWLETRCDELTAFVRPFCPPNTVFAFGDTAISQHTAPPRVVFVRPSEGADSIEPVDSTQSKDAVCVWRHRIEIHCWAAKGSDWGTDEAAAEQLARLMLFALFEFSQADMQLQGSWLTDSFTKQGRAIVLQAVLAEVVLKPSGIFDTTNVSSVGFQPDGTTTDGVLSAGEG